jgi:hypothetical protein
MVAIRFRSMQKQTPNGEVLRGCIEITPGDGVLLSESQVQNVILCAAPVLVTTRFVASTCLAWRAGLEYDVELLSKQEFDAHVAHVQKMLWGSFPKEVRNLYFRFYYDDETADPEDPRTFERWEVVVPRPNELALHHSAS